VGYARSTPISDRLASRLARALMLASAAALLGIPAPAAAAPPALIDGTVTPGSGTTATVFTFDVRYSSDTGFEAVRVWVEVAGSQVELALLTGDPEDGAWQGGSTLPVGDWPVTFRADASHGSEPILAGPTISVVAPDPPPPPATPAPTPVPTPVATATPGPMPAPTATPGAPPAPPPTGGPDPAPAPTVGGRVPAAPAPGASTAAGTGSTSSVPEASAGPGSSAGAPAPVQSGSPTATEVAALRDGAIDTFAEAREGTLAATSPAVGSGLGAVPWVLLGTAMAMIGAGILGLQVRARRGARPV
jgi:hypothetical protein